MSKAKLEFDLNDFDDRIEFDRVNKATDMAIVLFDMVYNVRKELSYKFEALEEKGETFTVYDGIDATLERLHEELNNKGIILDKIIV